MWWVRTGSHKGPIPPSTSSPAPTIHGLGGPIRRIVGASGVLSRVGFLEKGENKEEERATRRDFLIR